MSSLFLRSLNQFNKGNCFAFLQMSSNMGYKTLSVATPKEFVYHVKFNRPDKRNAINDTMWEEMKTCFDELSDKDDCRTVVLSGKGQMFSAGIDITSISSVMPDNISDDIARKAKFWYNYIRKLQKSVSSLEACKKPVLAAVHSACIGAGVDIICSADMRYCTKDAYFQVKEVELGLAADVGTLQRLPKVIGNDSLARELCYTARKLQPDEALSCGLVSRIYNNKEQMLEEVLKIAEEIASKSPVAVQGTKKNLIYARDHTVEESLEYMAVWNQAMLQSEDLPQAVMGLMSKEKNIVFSKL